MKFALTHIDTACCLLEIGGLRMLTDPVLDKPGKLYHHGFGAISRKTETPALGADELGKIDLILLSHPQHKDNFDHAGREFAQEVPLILSTPQIEKEFAHGKGMKPWDTYEIELEDGHTLTITATPAQHYPHWLPRFVSGHVIGFILAHSACQEVIYITGDTIYYNGIEAIHQRFPHIGCALIHVGSVRFPYLAGMGKFTMDAKGYVQTVHTLSPRLSIPIHTSGWTHFKENVAQVEAALERERVDISETKILDRGKKEEFFLKKR